MSRFGQRTRANSTVGTWLPQPQPPFSPSDLSPALWFDASDTSTITASSGAVSEWRDKSVNARHAIQATAANQPKTGTTTRNGYNVIDFDGVNDVLSTAALTLGYTISLFVVATTDGSSDQMIVCHGNANPSTSGTFYLFTNTPQFRHVETSGGFARNTTTSAYRGSWRYLTVIAKPATATIFRADGVSIASSESTATLTGWSNSAAITLGARSDGLYLKGSIAEVVLIESEVSASQRDSMETYLKTKWGL